MRPNIIIFNPDQMRKDALGHMGNSAAITPNLDRFSQSDAVSFSQAFCQNPVCVPSRCSFLSGLYPHVRGHRTMAHMLHSEESSLLEELKDAGYYVWMNPRNDFLPAQEDGVFNKHVSEMFYGGDIPEAPGPVAENPRGRMDDKNFYSFFLGELGVDQKKKNKTIDDESVDKAIEKIKHRPDDQPFCLFLGLLLPHPPYQIEEPYFSAIDKAKLPKRISTLEDFSGKPSILSKIVQAQHLDDWSETDWDELRSCYFGMCMKVDTLFGEICDALKDEGIYDDTIICVLSDHGDFTGDYGLVEKTQNTFEDCLVNVPLMIKPQCGVPVSPGISDSLVELIDFYATVMDLSGVESDHTHFGKSLKGVLADKTHRIREYVYTEGGRLTGELHCNETNGVKPKPYNPYYPRKLAQMDDTAHTKATMIRSARYKYIRRLYEVDEFYDLEIDPEEISNQINNPQYQDTIHKMRMEMLEWYQSTCDIVPFEQDKRFNFDMIWSRVKMNCPKEKEAEVKARIRSGEDMFHIIEAVSQMNREKARSGNQ